MLSAQAILLAGLGLLGTTSASPATPIGSPLKVVPIGPEISPTPLALPSPTPMALNNLSSPYTVTAYVPWNCDFNGLKIENWDLFVSTVASYCPFLGTGEASSCPNGTDMVLEGSLYPSAEVPGGQDTYVNIDGSMAITVQHEHEIPAGAYWEYIGWTWTSLPMNQPPFQPDCPQDNSMYNCSSPTGYWTFKAPNVTVGGVKACPYEYNSSDWSVYAVTPAFNRTDCVDLLGIGTHPYSGVNPPVWSYL